MDSFIYPAASFTNYHCTLLIHCHEQGESIEAFLDALEKVLAPIQLRFLLVVIDNASKDDTRACLESYTFQNPRIDLQILPLPTFRGLQAAIQIGLSSVKDVQCDRFLVMDAAGNDDPAAIPALLNTKGKDIVFVDKGPKTGHLLFWVIYRFHQFFFWLLTHREIRFDHFALINRRTLYLLFKKPFFHYGTALHLIGPLKKGKIRFEHQLDSFRKEYRKLFQDSMESLMEFGDSLLHLFLRFSFTLGFLLFGGLVYAGIKILLLHQEVANWIPFALLGLLYGVLLSLGIFALGILLLKRQQQLYPQAGQFSSNLDGKSRIFRIHTGKTDPVQLN